MKKVIDRQEMEDLCLAQESIPSKTVLDFVHLMGNTIEKVVTDVKDYQNEINRYREMISSDQLYRMELYGSIEELETRINNFKNKSLFSRIMLAIKNAI